MDIFDRIIYVIDKESKGVVSAFARKAEINPETLRSTIKNRTSFPGFEVITKILSTYNWINPDWLILGKEPIERKISEDIQNKLDIDMHSIQPEDREERLKSFIESQQRTIESQQRTIENLSRKGINFSAGSA